MVKEKTNYSFCKGEKLHLDDIYMVQGLAGGKWWEPVTDEGDDIVIVENVTIDIITTLGK
jgi:hypothetical protein